jgi:hypothetical protein
MSTNGLHRPMERNIRTSQRAPVVDTIAEPIVTPTVTPETLPVQPITSWSQILSMDHEEGLWRPTPTVTPETLLFRPPWLHPPSKSFLGTRVRPKSIYNRTALGLQSHKTTLQASRYNSLQPVPTSHTVVAPIVLKPTVMRPQDGPRTSVFKWSWSKSRYQCRIPKCRNKPGLWIYSFRVVSYWDPTTNLYLPGTWSKFFHAHSQVTRNCSHNKPGIRFTLYYNKELNVCPGS